MQTKEKQVMHVGWGTFVLSEGRKMRIHSINPLILNILGWIT